MVGRYVQRDRSNLSSIEKEKRHQLVHGVDRATTCGRCCVRAAQHAHYAQSSHVFVRAGMCDRMRDVRCLARLGLVVPRRVRI